jgi:hypothetical protein
MPRPPRMAAAATTTDPRRKPGHIQARPCNKTPMPDEKANLQKKRNLLFLKKKQQKDFYVFGVFAG